MGRNGILAVAIMREQYSSEKGADSATFIGRRAPGRASHMWGVRFRRRKFDVQDAIAWQACNTVLRLLIFTRLLHFSKFFYPNFR
jgi:hypothetical protein